MNDADFRRRLRDTFQLEAAEHLRALSADTARLATTAEAAEQLAAIERIFRETHTLKGAARMVGETDAEILCHALEQKLSQLKQARTPLAPPQIDALRDGVAEIARALHVALEAAVAPDPAPAPPVSLPPAPESAAPAVPASGGRVRVAGARLDALLLRAEEMVALQLTGDQNTTALQSLAHRGGAWKKELERSRPPITALRRLVDADPDAPIARELTSVLHYLDWTHEFLRELHGDLARLAKHTAQDHRRLGVMIEHLLDDTKEILVQPFSALLETFPGFVADLAREQGKQIDLEIHGGNTEIDRRVLDAIRDALLHLVRNAIDHGIEPAADRSQLGKPERGRLTVTVVERAGGTVEVSVSDDGRGIDPAEVTTSARRLGLLAADAAPPPEHEVLSLLFRSGFSTRPTPTELSGRGLGLAIVREKAERIGGNVTAESRRGRGTTFRIQVPLTLARFRGLFVQAAQQTFVIPAPYVHRVVRVRESELRQVNNQRILATPTISCVVLRLSEVLGLPRAPVAAVPDPDAAAFVVIIGSGHSELAIHVDAVPTEQEVVMKNLGPLLRGARAYVGATIVGGGRIVPVLNVNYLLEPILRSNTRGTAPTRPADPAAESKSRTILVVEDSITSRSLLKSILQAAGFTVKTAVDGADALTTLKFEPVDLVISDVQMPRLDGFELTSRIRSDPSLSTLPVILITSLASREDKERGVDAGANAYIVKSSFDQSDLLAAIGRLLR